MNYEQFQNIWLTDMASVKRFVINAGNTQEWSAEFDSALADFIVQASADILGEIGWLPIPYIDTLFLDYSSTYVSQDSRQLFVTDAPLLEITTLTNGNTSVIAGSGFVLQPNNRYPKRYVNLLTSGGSCTAFVPSALGKWQQAISILGVWGYVPHYERCWINTGQTILTNPLSAGATTLTVTNAGVFSRGQYLHLESETVLVVATNTSTNVLTIERGVLGTTPAIHIATTPIYRYQHVTAIQTACTEWSAYLWKNKDKVGEQIELFDNGVAIAQGLSPRVYRALAQHADWRAVPA